MEQVNTTSVNKIPTFSKWNPFIFKSDFVTNKRFKNYYNVLKYGIALIMTFITLIALWFSTNWQAVGLDEKKTFLFDTLGIQSIEKLFVTNPEVYKQMISMPIYEWSSSSISKPEINVLIGFSFAALIFIIPTILFKNGTAYSIGFIVLEFIFLIVIIVLLSKGIATQISVIKTFNNNKTEINESIKTLDEYNKNLVSISNLKTQISFPNNPNINELKEKLNVLEEKQQVLLTGYKKIQDLFIKLIL